VDCGRGAALRFDNVQRARMTASPISRMGHLGGDGWRESSRTARRAPAPRTWMSTGRYDASARRLGTRRWARYCWWSRGYDVNPGNTVITPATATVNISPIGFHHYASQFAASARQAQAGLGGTFSPVPYYLYCRSLELVLKAFLLAKGVPKDDLNGGV